MFSLLPTLLYDAAARRLERGKNSNIFLSVKEEMGREFVIRANVCVLQVSHRGGESCLVRRVSSVEILKPILECTQNLQAISRQPILEGTLSFSADWALSLTSRKTQHFRIHELNQPSNKESLMPVKKEQSVILPPWTMK